MTEAQKVDNNLVAPYWVEVERLPARADGSIPERQVFTAGDYAVLVDDAGSGVTYIGNALPGTTTSSANWKIKRMTEVGADITIVWADGDSLYDNVWDNRASLSYS